MAFQTNQTTHNFIDSMGSQIQAAFQPHDHRLPSSLSVEDRDLLNTSQLDLNDQQWSVDFESETTLTAPAIDTTLDTPSNSLGQSSDQTYIKWMPVVDLDLLIWEQKQELQNVRTQLANQDMMYVRYLLCSAYIIY